MTRLISTCLLFLTLLLLSSCLTIRNHLELNRDGSGVRTVTIDMSDLFGSPLFAMAMASEDAKPMEDQDSTWQLINDFRDLNPQWTAEEVALLEKVTMNLRLDEDEGEMLITLNTPFDDLDQLEQIERLIDTAKRPAEEDDDDATGSNPMGDFTGGQFGGSDGFTFRLRNKTLEITADLNEGDALGDFMDVEDENAKLVMGFLDEASIIYSYTLPGQVKSVDALHDAEVDGNTVTQRFRLVDQIEGQPELSGRASGTIKFK